MPPKSSPICLLYLYTFLLDKLLLSLVPLSYLSIPLLLLLILYNALWDDLGTFYNLFVKQNNLINEINELFFEANFARTSPFCL